MALVDSKPVISYVGEIDVDRNRPKSAITKSIEILSCIQLLF